MQSITKYISVIVLLFLAFWQTPAQSPVSWQLSTDAAGKTLKSGDKLKATLKATIEGDWHMYALDQPEGEGPRATKITLADDRPFKLAGTIAAPKPTAKFDPNFNINSKFYLAGAEFMLPLEATGEAKAEELLVKVYFQVCNDTTCLPPKTVKVTLAGFEDEKKNSFGSSTGSNANNAPPEGDVIFTQGTPANSVITKPAEDQNLWSFLWLAVTVGALSLLTPCVFPMIPITVSYFTNHAAGSRAKALKLASVYSLGIIATFTLLGMLLAIFIGAAGINLFAANPWVNLLITAIFLFFAFNLFGAYEITIPSSILTSLDKLTRTKEGEGSGIVGALLMGLTFTLTSFTCTSPFVGTILVSTAQGNWQMPLLGMLVFSTVFALPFFVLALMPQLISQLPRAGAWMNSVKVAMGFLEVAAAMKFISNVDLIWKWGIFTRSAVLAIWISIGVILSVYLLGKFQLFHDSKPERIGAMRLVSAIISLAISFYLLTGLFGAKMGELESFLPPETNATRSAFSPNKDELTWIENDYEGALQKAKGENKKVFIDFTGYTCTNCRWMEANVFNKPEVEAELKKFVLVRLYTDGEGEVYDKQQAMEQQVFGTVALPYYAVMDGQGKPAATFPGLTRNVGEFVSFLQSANGK
jgi:thiol:disulfide interchange protein